MLRSLPPLLLACILPFASSDEPICPGNRAIRYRVDVAAPRDEVWRAWTTPAGLGEWLAPAALVELEPLGRFEILFSPEKPAGQRGAEQNLVLAVQEPEMLAFTWDAPPHLPEAREQRTSVVVRLEALAEGSTRVWFEQTGWGRGGEWDQAFEYFTQAWRAVLAILRLRCAAGPLEAGTRPASAVLEPHLAAVVRW